MKQSHCTDIIRYPVSILVIFLHTMCTKYTPTKLNTNRNTTILISINCAFLYQ
ncbi:hypothetical protein GpSGHVEth142 [Glossina pallidipes salivary gland hypertrophy virus]|uniref:Uncharacterized protein n=1 Tax=Glossina hytrovirus (isolate Glossina pallidipes/Ethiopia/Seibersdorf/-) TaxID=379529 RepID=A0A125QZQ7_GHVS|nr:hypothetical protein GpSGHVEth142 [Glossina pallidipes salivary gland hypertrophy virus]